MPRQFEIVSVDRVFNGFFALDQAKVRFETIDGSMSEVLPRLSVERGDAAAVLLHLVDEKAFLFARQFRYPCVAHGNAWLIEAVAGKIEPDETPESAIRREAEEESGFELKEVHSVGAFYGSPGGLSELTHVFYAAITRADQIGLGGGNDHGEDIEMVKIQEDEAIRMALNGEIRDGKALIGLLWFAATLRS
jgi:ADP-ribose pyrophosphatase